MSWLALKPCFSALISRQLPPTKERARHACQVSGEQDRHPRQIYSSARGLCHGQVRRLFPSSRLDGSEVVAQISHHTVGFGRLPWLAWAGGASDASSELLVLLQHLDPITQHLARRAGAWERGQRHALPWQGCKQPAQERDTWKGCSLLRGLPGGHSWDSFFWAGDRPVSEADPRQQPQE